MSFYVGQRVVCLHDDPPMLTPGWTRKFKGAVYTVAKTQVYAGPDRGFVGLMLRELVAPSPHEAWFCATRFRPITERKTSIEIFKAMLNPSKTEVSA